MKADWEKAKTEKSRRDPFGFASLGYARDRQGRRQRYKGDGNSKH
jgi:hypothetical protein